MTAKAAGWTLLSIVADLKKQGGDAIVRELLEATSESTREVFAKRIMGTHWYPYAVFADILEAIDRRLARGDREMFRALGRSSAEKAMDTIFSIYKNGGHERLHRLGQNVWKRFYENAGRLEFTALQPDDTTQRIIEFSEKHPLHCRMHEGWFQGAMEALGLEIVDPFQETKCASRGDPYHEFHCTWRPL